MDAWKVITPGNKLGNAPASGPYLIKTEAGLDIGTATTEEHARMMAAAPALFHACQAAVAYWTSRHKSNRDAAMEIIDDAMRKAKNPEVAVA